MDCVLRLETLVFDEISFKRTGLRSEDDLEISLSVNIGESTSNADIKKVTVKVCGDKRNEYTFEVEASGYFSYEGNVDDEVIEHNAVAIVMPYVRSEVSILTAQPGVDPVVLQPFNIVELMKGK